MRLFEKEKEELTVRRLFAVLQLFCTVTLIACVARKKMMNVGACFASMGLLCAPWLFERLFHVRLGAKLKCVLLLYAVAGPVGGNVYRLYYLIPWWDKFMHLLCGVVFAMIGYSAPDALEPQNRHGRAIKRLCAVATALSIAVLWEFFEFGGDRLLGLDLQNDYYVNSIHSYVLGSSMGEMGSIEPITEVIVNGQKLDGYLDIGLYDTMEDLFVNFIGAVVFSTIGYFYIKHRGQGKLAKAFIPTITETDAETPSLPENPPEDSSESE